MPTQAKPETPVAANDKPAKDDQKGAKPAKETRPAPVPLTPWQEYAQALLLTNEFMFVD